jgi:hypothetical protein
MKQQNKFSIGHHQEQAAESQAKGQSAALEFQTPEELLRHDAAQTAVPPEIVRRLSQSIAESSAAPKPWWRKLIG